MKEMILPRKIAIAASTACQLKCPSCPTASGEVGKALGVGHLRFHDFKKVVDENPWVSQIELSNWGEMFLNKELGNIIKYAYKKNVALKSRNGVNLNHVDQGVLEALVRYRFRAMTCSIDGASQGTYSRYRVGGDFDKVIGNIKIINRLKRQHDSPFPVLWWQYIAFGHNESEIGKARRMAVDLNMKFSLKLSWEDLYSRPFSPIRNADLIRRETGLGVANRSEFRARYGKEYALRASCVLLWKEPRINYDGRVLGCSINYWGDFGNAFSEGLKESLNNERINHARDMLMGLKEGREDVPCTQCKAYQSMKKERSWFTEEDVEPRFTLKRRSIMLENKVLGYEMTKRMAKQRASLLRMINDSKDSRARGDLSRTDGSYPGSRDGLTSKVYPLKIPLQPDEEMGWRSLHIFKGPTRSLQELSCHVSVLGHGQCPHLPHKHKEEELLILLSGEVDLILLDERDKNVRKRLRAGQLAYYPAYFAHALQTVSKKPAYYMMFKWYGGAKGRGTPLAFSRFDMQKSGEGAKVTDGFQMRILFRGPTDNLQKLHCHTSSLTPGAGYPAHSDPYDVAIIMLEGAAQTLGVTAEENSVIFYAAGEPHGMHAVGETDAKYVVFEFHGSKVLRGMRWKG